MNYEDIVMSASELLAKEFETETYGWKFREDNLTIVYWKDGHIVYDIDLEELTNCGEILDTIIQVSETKTWATPECVKGLIALLNALLDLQANFCSFGANKKVSGKRLQELISKNASNLRIAK